MTEPDSSNGWKLGLSLMVLICFLRGLNGLWSVVHVAPYLGRGSLTVMEIFAVIVGQTLVWIALGVLLWKRWAPARAIAIVWCGIILLWSSYQFISATIEQRTGLWNMPLFIFNIATDLLIIAVLSRSEAAQLFQKNSTSDAVVK